MAKATRIQTEDQRVKVNSLDPNADFLINKLESSDNSIAIVANSCNDKIDLTAQGGFTEKWIKSTVVFGDFSTAGTVIRITPTEFDDLPAGTFLLAYKIKHSIKFEGGTISAADLGISIKGSAPTDLPDTLDVNGIVSNTNYIALANTYSTNNNMDHAVVDDLFLVMNTTGDNLDQLTAGVAEIWIKTVTLI